MPAELEQPLVTQQESKSNVPNLLETFDRLFSQMDDPFIGFNFLPYIFDEMTNNMFSDPFFTDPEHWLEEAKNDPSAEVYEGDLPNGGHYWGVIRRGRGNALPPVTAETSIPVSSSPTPEWV